VRDIGIISGLGKVTETYLFADNDAAIQVYDSGYISFWYKVTDGVAFHFSTYFEIGQLVAHYFLEELGEKPDHVDLDAYPWVACKATDKLKTTLGITKEIASNG
jgi:hypothetical protein